MLKIKPPTHRIDAGGIVISSLDAWDQTRILAETDQLEAAALTELQDKAEQDLVSSNSAATDAEVAAVRDACVLSDDDKTAIRLRHPVQRYFAGLTRFQPDCADWDPAGKPTTARAYLTAQPTEFAVRRLSYAEYHRAMELPSTIGRLTGFVRKGLRAVRSPDGGFNWEAKKGEDEAPEDVVQALHEANPLLIRELGAAIISYNRPLDDDEGKR